MSYSEKCDIHKDHSTVSTARECKQLRAIANAPDYERVRQSATCPVCNGDKDQGLLVCWPCYRAHNVRNGLSTTVKSILDGAEAGYNAAIRYQYSKHGE